MRAIGQATNETWLVELSDATQEAYSGATTKAISKLENLQTNSRLSAIERQRVGKVLNAAKTGGQDIGVNMAKAAVSVMLVNVIKKSSLTPLMIDKLPKKYRAKLIRYIDKN